VHLSITRKALILITIPLVFQGTFVALLAWSQAGHADAINQSFQSREAVAEANLALHYMIDAETGIRGYLVTDDKDFKEPYALACADLPAHLRRLKELVQDNREQAGRAESIEAAADVALDWLRQTEQMIEAGQHEAAVERMKTRQGKRLMDDLREHVGRFTQTESQLAQDRRRKMERFRQAITALLVGGLAMSVLLTGTLAVVFWKEIGRRFALVTANTQRLAAGKPLLDMVDRGDEIAALDRVFRETALELSQSNERLRQSAEEIRDLYNRAPCGYQSLAGDGTIIAINDTELHWLQYDRDEVVGRLKFSELLTEASQHKFAENFPRFKECGFINNVEYELVRKDGSVLPVLLNATAVVDAAGRYVSSRATLFDVTERKRAEEEIRTLNRDLEERVRSRTNDLEEANRELNQKNRENEMFVYSVSHDLRSPLVNLQGFSKELQKGCDALGALLADERLPLEARAAGQALLDGKMAKALGFIQTAVLRLGGIIDALLRLSRARRVEFRWQWAPVNEIVARILESLHGTIAEKRVTVRQNELTPVWGDPTALEQVFANLIGNALNYLDPARPGIIEIGCRRDTEGPSARNVTVYYVRDNGLGVAPAHQHKIFQVFQRVHPGAAKGEGIGLAIVSSVVERHRGRIWVESSEGAGSTFFVSLPTEGAVTRANPASVENRDGRGGVPNRSEVV
jgi:PAS domain S-box-containing protein